MKNSPIMMQSPKLLSASVLEKANSPNDNSVAGTVKVITATVWRLALESEVGKLFSQVSVAGRKSNATGNGPTILDRRKVISLNVPQ